MFVDYLLGLGSGGYILVKVLYLCCEVNWLISFVLDLVFLCFVLICSLVWLFLYCVVIGCLFFVLVLGLRF